MKFGDNLEEIRKKYGIPMSVIGDRAGIHRSQMCRYVKDIDTPSFKTMTKIIEACPVSWDWEIDGYLIKEKKNAKR